MASPLSCAIQGGTYNSYTDSCEGSDQPGICFYPYVWDYQSEQCVMDTSFQNSNPNPPTTTVVQQGNVTVNVNNAVNVADSTVDALANAVGNAVTQGAKDAAQIAKNAADAVIKGVGDVATAIGDSTKSALQKLWDGLDSVAGWIKDHLTTIIQAIADNVGTAVKTIASAVKDSLESAATIVNKVATEIQTVNDDFIKPISNTINAAVQTISGLTTAIENDLHSGLSGILQIPSDIAGAMTSLDATMQRTVQQMGLSNKDTLTTVVTGPVGDVIGKPIGTIGSSLSGVMGKDARKATFSEHVKLPEPGTLAVAGDLITATWKQIHDVISSLMHNGQDNINQLKAALSEVPFMLGDIVELPVTLLILGSVIVSELRPLLEYEHGSAAAKMGLTKLRPGDAIEAALRGFIDQKTLETELSFEGYDAERIKVMQDLQIQLFDVSHAMDMYYRGMIQLSDLQETLQQHGFTPDDQDLLVQQAQRVIDPANVIKAYRYGVVPIEQVRNALQAARYTDQEQTLVLDTIERHESMDDVVTRLRITNLYSGLGFSDPAFADVPQDLRDAARREGADSQIALDVWQRSYWVPQIDMYIDLYFRGVRTLKELYAVMDYYAVPEQIRQDIVAHKRALIPYRTIPAMLSKGIITEPYAKDQLQAHGFDLQATEAILKYAVALHPTVAANSSGNTHAQSVGTAKSLWEMGALTDDQYEAVLVEHGYTQDIAVAVVHTEKIADMAKARKQIAVDITNEVTSGLITIDQAKQQMTANNFTSAEIAKVLNAISRQGRQNNKIPSEGELHGMASKGAITVDVYASTLGLLGYSADWVAAFVKYRFGGSDAATA